jgi:branched-chain amino acid transport system ATP-binding protein
MGMPAAKTTTAPLLSVRGATRSFGALVALDSLSFDINAGEIFGTAGPNGAGKSTLLNVCTGMLKPNAGKIFFDNERIDGWPPHRLCHKGLARTFQIAQIFDSMSVAENIAVGTDFGLGRKSTDGRTKKEFRDEILTECGLNPKRDMMAGKVDLLTRKMTMLAAALATKPKLVFMDEPLAGFTSAEIDQMVALILHLRKTLEITFMIIEHKVRALAYMSDRIMILHHGQRICLDAPLNVMRDPKVVEIYLGSESVA